MSMIAEFIIIGLVTVSSSKGTPSEYIRAADSARKALMATPAVKKTIKRATKYTEKKITKYTGVTKEDLVYVSWAMTLVYGKVSTKPFKHLSLKKGNWVVRPELEYTFDSQNVESMLVFNYTF